MAPPFLVAGGDCSLLAMPWRQGGFCYRKQKQGVLFVVIVFVIVAVVVVFVVNVNCCWCVIRDWSKCSKAPTGVSAI